MFTRKPVSPIAIALAVIAIGAGAYGIFTATAANGPATAVTTAVPAFRSGGSPARSGSAAGGSVGTVDGVSASSFTLTTPAGQTVTVTTKSPTASVKPGKNVLVLGTVNGTTIAAATVTVQASSGAAKSKAAGVVPFQQGAPSSAKQTGRIPANYSQGSGTIVGGTTARKATTSALAAYPGGIVDRVVNLGNGDYEVHTIGVNWPHHIFVNPSFTVIGAN